MTELYATWAAVSGWAANVSLASWGLLCDVLGVLLVAAFHIRLVRVKGKDNTLALAVPGTITRWFECVGWLLILLGFLMQFIASLQ